MTSSLEHELGQLYGDKRELLAGTLNQNDVNRLKRAIDNGGMAA